MSTICDSCKLTIPQQPGFRPTPEPVNPAPIKLLQQLDKYGLHDLCADCENVVGKHAAARQKQFRIDLTRECLDILEQRTEAQPNQGET